MAVDLFAPCGTPWLAVFEGYAWPYDVPNGGHALSLRHADGSVAYYAHGESGGRPEGYVRAGEVIGRVSDSGNAAGTGCHLHFAISVGTNIYPDGSGNTRPADWLAGVAVAPAPPAPGPPEPPPPPPEPAPAPAPPAGPGAAPLPPASGYPAPGPDRGKLIGAAAVAVLLVLLAD
jgi:murein DD-endopeptidase MepM/ murein hydrolase activator NlpD